jgi:hypothetical protein
MTTTTVNKMMISTVFDSSFTFTYEVAGVPVNLTAGYTSELRLKQKTTGTIIYTFSFLTGDIILGAEIGNIEVLIPVTVSSVFTDNSGTWQLVVDNGSEIEVAVGCWMTTALTPGYESTTIVSYSSREEAANDGIGFGESFALNLENEYGMSEGVQMTQTICE